MSACPWDGFEPAVRAFCETNRCAWIAQPANTVSSLAYVVVGALLLRQVRKHPIWSWFGWISIAVGIGSVLCHGTFTLLGELTDLGAMYFFSALLLALNLRRLGKLGDGNWRSVFLVVATVSTAFFVKFPREGIWLFGAQVGLFLAIELGFFVRRKKTGTSYRDLGKGLGIFAVSYGIWHLDYQKILCAPDNHWLQGHAVWHLLNSVVIHYAARFYAQFGFRQ